MSQSRRQAAMMTSQAFKNALELLASEQLPGDLAEQLVYLEGQIVDGVERRRLEISGKHSTLLASRHQQELQQTRSHTDDEYQSATVE